MDAILRALQTPMRAASEYVGQLCTCCSCNETKSALAPADYFVYASDGKLLCAACHGSRAMIAEVARRPSKVDMRLVDDFLRGDQPFSCSIARLAEFARAIGFMAPPRGALVIEAGAVLAHHAFGPKVVEQIVRLLNACTLATLAVEGMTFYRFEPRASWALRRMVLPRMPEDRPPLWRGPFALETRHPKDGDQLFAKTTFLGGYSFQGIQFLVGNDAGVGFLAAGSFVPTWGTVDIARALRLVSWGHDAVEHHRNWIVQGSLFALNAAVVLHGLGQSILTREDRVLATSDLWKARLVIAPSENLPS